MVRSEFAVGHHSVSSAYCLSIHLGVAQQAERVEYLAAERRGKQEVDVRGVGVRAHEASNERVLRL